MMALRNYNAAVDFMGRNVAEGRGDKTAFIVPARNLAYAELRDATVRIGRILARLSRSMPMRSVPRQDSIFRSITKLALGRPLRRDRMPMWRAATYLRFCVIWRWAC